MSPPALIDRPIVARRVTFANRGKKAVFMERRAEADARDPKVIAVARRFMAIPRPERERAILRFCQFCITYEPDPVYRLGGQVRHVQLLRDAAVTLDLGSGKCTDKAALVTALCRASGIEAREAPVFRGLDGFPHVRNEIRGVDGAWRLADACVLNSTIGHVPRRHLITNLRPR